MNVEHYKTVSEQFNLQYYSCLNSIHGWSKLDVLKTATVSDLRIIESFNHDWAIVVKNEYRHNVFVFVKIPSRELALEILNFTKQTEILFV